MSCRNNAKITLITLTRSSETLDDTLKSVFEQDYSNIEHLIVDEIQRLNISTVEEYSED